MDRLLTLIIRCDSWLNLWVSIARPQLCIRPPRPPEPVEVELIGTRSTGAPRKKYALSVSHTSSILSRRGADTAGSRRPKHAAYTWRDAIVPAMNMRVGLGGTGWRRLNPR